MSYRPGDAYFGGFTTASPTTGAAANADTTPVATATRNGTDDGAFALTVNNLATGRYKLTGTVPPGYNSGDVVQISVAATVGGVAGVAVVDRFTVGDFPGVAVEAKVAAAPAPTATNFGGQTPAGGALPAVAGYYVDANLPMQVCFTSGGNKVVKKRVTGYTPAGVFTTDAFPATPAANDTFDVI